MCSSSDFESSAVVSGRSAYALAALALRPSFYVRLSRSDREYCRILRLRRHAVP